MNDSEQEAYAAFFRMEQPVILRTIYLMTSDMELANEVSQEAFAQAFVHWNKVARYDRPGAWVRRVAIRLASRARRRARLQEALLQRTKHNEPFDQPLPDPSLSRAIDSLSLKEKALVTLAYYEDLPFNEIGDILDMSEGAARVGLHRAKKKLAKLLGGGDDSR